MSRTITAEAAKRLVHDGGELAFLDVREAGEFGEGHPLLAVPCAYSTLEARVGALVPRRAVRVLLVDGGDGVARRAAMVLEDLGYGCVMTLDGGAPAWAMAGYTLFKGVNVPSKTLGELAEHAWHPATIDAATLKRWQDEGHDFGFFDVRPPTEYAKMRVPGATCLPNGELAHRFGVAVDDPAAPVVVTCAGRTRGIVGALNLRLAGIDQPVYALENGTQGWQLAGYALERGNTAAPFPALDDGGAAAARSRADALISRYDIPVVDAETVTSWRADGTRTTYLFDLRTPEEITANPAPAFVPVLSGQLVQATDQWVGVRHARLVLLDDLGLRGAITAFWLRQLGYTVAVARLDGALMELPASQAAALPPLDRIGADDALGKVRAGRGQLLDLRGSQDFRRSHVAGARWGIRPRLGRLRLDLAKPVYMIGADEVCTLAAKDLAALGATEVRAVQGGQQALIEAGAVLETCSDTPGDAEAIDFLRFVHDRHDGNLESSRRYLAWEQGLIAQLDADERAAFTLSAIAP